MSVERIARWRQITNRQSHLTFIWKVTIDVAGLPRLEDFFVGARIVVDGTARIVTPHYDAQPSGRHQPEA